MRKGTIALLATCALMAIGCGAVDTSDEGSAGAAPKATKQETPAKPSGPASTITADGTYLVGTDIKPGQWRAKVDADSVGCYWEREKDTTGGMNSILANENVDAGGQAIVTIKKSDAAFKTAGCGTWTRISG